VAILIDMQKTLPPLNVSPKRKSLSRRFSVTLSVVVVCILFFFSMGVILYNTDKIKRSLNEQLSDALTLAETSLPTAVWQMDYSSMDDILEAILINNNIAAVRIFTDGVIAAAKTQPKYTGTDFTFFKNSAEFTVQSVDVQRLGEKVGIFEVALSSAEMNREQTVTIMAVTVLALVLCTAILLTSVLITRQYIFKPLKRLEDHARMIAEGKLETHIETESDDELSQLANAFNIMADQLKISFDTLEQKVKERTADLYRAKTQAERMNLHLEIVGAELQALLDNSPVGILFLSFDRVIQRMNREITRITGFSQEDLLGGTTRKFYASDEAYRSFGEKNYPLLKNNGFCETELELIKKDGSSVTCYLRGRTVIAESGTEGIVWTLEDLTMRLKMEEELLKVKKLESIGVFAGGIAHDFNNLLLAIIGNISLAQHLSAQNSVVHDLLASAGRASERARDLTVKLLTFAGGGDPVKVSESLPHLLQESAAFVLSGSNVKCIYQFAPDLWAVNMDRAQISQVIQNLVLNADQSMPDGGIINISCSNVQLTSGEIPGLEKGNFVRVSVKDHGVGIPKKILGRIFDPYFSTKEKDASKGSGLGLAIVHSIISKHGGAVTVSSEPGSGSTFTLYLPAIALDLSPEAEPAEELLHPGKGRILLMDDEEMIQNVVGTMLGLLGYEPVITSDGAEAVAVYRKNLASGHPFDAVIMDLTIPGGMGGAEAIKKILELDPGAKVIVSSGYSHDPILTDYKKFGFCNIVSKPYQLKDLSRVLQETLSG
jgi:two-component system cell cycle sensor histidine kinase/response regulator CckA